MAISPADRSVSVLAYEGMTLFETGITTEVFGLRWPGIEVPWYDLRICAESPGQVGIAGGASLSTPYGLETLSAAATVIIPSYQREMEVSPELISALRLAHQRGARIVSICSGAFVLAAAGLLDGRRATTHWQYAEMLRARYPLVTVDANPLYVDEGDVLTSAGCAAGVDLCLHLVRQDYGASIANALARRMIVQPHRDGGQAQYIEAPMASDPADDRIARTMTWALGNLAEPITVESLARRAHMSTRTYLRHFARAAGTSPIRWLITQRIQASLALLESSDLSVEEITTAVGFDAAVTFRHHFGKAMRTSPSAYRRTFQLREAASS